MSSLPRTSHVPATPTDAPVYTLPISQELADLLAPRIMRTTTRIGRCWLRNENYRQKTGYTYISRAANGEKKHYLAHRIVYVHYFGPIPEGLTIDHLCEQRACVNPKHLRAVTLRQNVLRSAGNPFAINARRKDCSRGHGVREEGKKCPKCLSEQARERRLKRKEAGVPANEAHGTERAYRHWSCRCAECSEWQRQDYRARRAGAS